MHDAAGKKALADAIARISAGDVGKAAKALRELAEKSPQDGRLQFYVGTACELQDDYEDAVRAYGKAIEFGLDDSLLPKAMLGLGNCLRQNGDRDTSVRVLARACTRFPDFKPLRLFLAISLAHSGRSPEAVSSLLDLLLDNPASYIVDEFAPALRRYVAEAKANLTPGR
jgi:Flp pilus assembly protein TadD